MNQGAVAGAGVQAHLHQHVVPRWGGDSNFLPVIAQTKALPMLLEDVRRRLATCRPAEARARRCHGGGTSRSSGRKLSRQTTSGRKWIFSMHVGAEVEARPEEQRAIQRPAPQPQQRPAS